MPRFGDLVKIVEKKKPEPFRLTDPEKHQPPHPGDPEYRKATNKIIELVEQEPGLNVMQLRKRSNLNSNTMTTLPYAMVKRGHIKARTQDGLIRFYPNVYRFADEMQAKATPKTREVYGVYAPQILAVVRDNPGITSGEVKAKLPQLNFSTVASTLNRLHNKGKISFESTEGGAYHYRLAEPNETVEVEPKVETKTEEPKIIEALVKDYLYHAWEHNEANPSLRGFITWLKEGNRG